MRRTEAILASIMLIILIPNICVSKPVPLSQAYSININQIDSKEAAVGNSNIVAIDISINQFEYFLCGLNAGNFIIDTLNAPPNGHNVSIYSVGGSSKPHGGSILCNYSMNIAPASYQDKQYPWVEGNYTFQVTYVRNGQKLAAKTFILAVI